MVAWAARLVRSSLKCEYGVSMGMFAKPVNRALFLACVVATGALAGAFVWAFFFLMDAGLGFLWDDGRLALAGWLEQVAPALARGPFGVALFPFLVCVTGGLVIGLYEKKVGVATESLNAVMAKVKRSGRYEYDNLGKLSIAALLPLLFGGSVGPEAGLTGVIAGLCTWVGDRLRRFGGDFRAMTMLGCQAALTALFTAPLYGFPARPMARAAGKSRCPSGRRRSCTPALWPVRLRRSWDWGHCSAAAWVCRASMRLRWVRSSLRGSCRLPRAGLRAVGCTTGR